LLCKQNLTHTITGLFGEVQWAKPEMPTITENSSDGHWQNSFLPQYRRFDWLMSP